MSVEAKPKRSKLHRSVFLRCRGACGRRGCCPSRRQCPCRRRRPGGRLGEGTSWARAATRRFPRFQGRSATLEASPVSGCGGFPNWGVLFWGSFLDGHPTICGFSQTPHVQFGTCEGWRWAGRHHHHPPPPSCPSGRAGAMNKAQPMSTWILRREKNQM